MAQDTPRICVNKESSGINDHDECPGESVYEIKSAR